MNKQGIALAADSAVTIGEGPEQKIFTSASKIFTLSKYQPVGVMIYGSASLMGMPWETIIKIYRDKLGHRSLAKVEDYASDFLSFVTERDELFPDEEQLLYVEHCIYSYFRLIEKEFTKCVSKKLEIEKEIDEAGTRRIASDLINDHFQKWSSAEPSISVPKEFKHDFRLKHRNLIREAKKEVFEKLPLTSRSSRQLTEIAINLFVKFPDGLGAPFYSGVVFAGFGTEDVFPVLEAYSIELRIGHYLKHRRDEDACMRITFTNRAAIRPFAQSEMVLTFMTGIDPDYQVFMNEYMYGLCSEYPNVLVDSIDGLGEEERETLKIRLRDVGQSTFEQYLKELLSYRRKHHIDTVMNVVWALPIDELAAMAESLISLTSFKRRVSATAETVSGPIDVAVISKGDGFIWIKRKHYFESDLNHQFLANYYREDPTNDQERIEEEGTDSVSVNEGVQETLFS